MTYGQIRMRLKQLLPEISGLDLIDGWLRDRYAEILDALKWQRLDKSAEIDTEAGTAIYALPADCRILKSVASQDGILRPWESWMDAAPETSGTPVAWQLTIDDESDPPRQQVKLFPTPAEVETLDVEYTAEKTLTGATSVTLLPWVRESCIVAGVMSDGLAHLENFRGADRQEARFLKLLADMQRTEIFRTPMKALKVSDKYNAARWKQPASTRRVNYWQ